MLDKLIVWFSENQFLSGGAVLMGLGGVLVYGRQAGSLIWTWFVNQTTVVVDISNDDPAYRWIQKWLNENTSSQKIRRITAKSHNRDVNSDVHFIPSTGIHLLRYRGKFILLSRNKKDVSLGDGSSGMLAAMAPETITIRIIGCRDKNYAKQLFQEARKVFFPTTRTLLTIKQGLGYAWSTRSVEPRPANTVILEKGLMENILSDVKTFLGRKAWYQARSIPYRRGYLLFGAPGNGKTSIIKVVASEFDLPIHSINMKGLSDSSLQDLISDIPPKSILLLEDIDCVTSNREEKNEEKGIGVSLSGLLNTLDGISSPEDYLLFMTTNYPEKLDSALKRPGRIDKQIELKNATEEQAYRLWKVHFPDDASGAAAFSKEIGSNVSMATLQEKIITQSI